MAEGYYIKNFLPMLKLLIINYQLSIINCQLF